MIDLTPVWISLKTAITATIITFFLGIFSAWWMLGCKSKFKAVIESILTAPLVLPPTVVGFLLLLLFGKNGFIGQLLAHLFDFTIIFSWYATVIASTVVAFPLMYKTALGAFKQIDTNLLACARTLGAGEWVIFWRIMLPLAKYGLMAGTLLSFARALGEFGATLMLAGSIPNKTETIPIAIFFASEGGDMDKAMLLVIIMLAISLGVISFVNYATEGKGFDKLKRHHQSRAYNLRFWAKKPFLSSKNQNYPLPQAKIELVVQIQKQLSEFCLDVNFKTDQTPLGLLGASGAGKSMILRCIAGLETPDRGLIILNGKVLFDSSQKINLPPRERNCGFLFQNYALFPHLTVAENIAFGMSPKQSYREMKTEIERQLITVGLSGMGNYYPKQLSGGQQQRVALARAKASEPEIMLLDEPFSALDTYLRDKQEKLLRNSLIHYQGVTLFITHNLEEAYRVCPHLLIIDQGSAIASGRKQDIFEHPPNFRSAQLTGCKNFSSVEVIDHNKIKALDWNCILEVIEPVSPSLQHIGIRAYHLVFPDTHNQINTFPCWLATISETQHRVTLYLKLNQPANHPEDYHLQAEVFKDKWMQLKDSSFPWTIQLNPLKIMLFT
ncbi:molybdate ABC transporter permease subunit [Cyanobacterium sp. Dongsha4]|uniref:molybdate ABC transporter permease subunit n=1 Tax=Cyanobacterium sp. DS4 TaxID=2878255 RepID=UPI002E8144EA|nr:molybdate ABC transporter permease subunit [Cyanobacterium sp. Dongsha4]WVL00203.1 molybdate ABC transporter permease subunit [Cyanobacterium sp. Dongsha4]